MNKYNKLYKEIMLDCNNAVSFADLVYFLLQLGFLERINGDHHIFKLAELPEIINIQPEGNMAKPYQVKQVRRIVSKYKLGREDYE